MTASVGSRVVASIVDGITWAVPAILILVFFGMPAVGWLILESVAWAVYEVLATTYFGGTIGKLVCGIRVVDREGRYPGVQQSFTRFLVKTIEPISTVATVMTNVVADLLATGFLVYQIALFVSVVRNPLHQGWHDRLADTYVAYKRDVGTAVITEAPAETSSPDAV